MTSSGDHIYTVFLGPGVSIRIKKGSQRMNQKTPALLSKGQNKTVQRFVPPPEDFPEGFYTIGKLIFTKTYEVFKYN